MTEIKTRIQNLFDDAQKDSSNHQENCILLLEIIKSSNFQDFLDNLTKTFLIKKKAICVQRVFSFVSSFVQLSVNERDLINKIHDYLEKCLLCNDRYMKLHSCQLINQLMAIKSFDVEDRLKNCLLESIKYEGDISFKCTSVVVLSKYQHLSEVVKCLCSLMSHDSFQIRRAVVRNTIVNEASFPFFVERSRDIDTSVRVIAFEKLSSSVHLIKENSNYMRIILENGLKDENDSIRKICENILTMDLFKLYSNDIFVVINYFLM
jgi:hypothetical protein